MNLRLLQLGDSALPIGGYSHSWGLEAAVEQGLVRDPAGLEDWVRSWLRHGVTPFEGVVVAAVCRAAGQHDWPAVREANEFLWAGLAVPSSRHASRDMGEQLLALAEGWPWAREQMAVLRRMQGPAATRREWHHAVIFGTLTAAAGCDPEEAVSVFLHQAALGMIGAGVRAIPIGHTHGQQILARLHEDIQNLAKEYAAQELETAGSFCPRYEEWCHAQGRLYTRLFRS